MTTINDTVSLLSGGRPNANSYSAQTWYYNHDTEAFTSGPDLLEGRRRHGSAANVDKVTKAKIAVITGGWNSSKHMDSTELLINGQWEAGIIQRYTYRVLQTIQMRLILLCVWAERAILGSAKTALKFKYEIQFNVCGRVLP